MFPSLSRISEPLPRADQPTASSGPPRDKRSLGFRLVSGDRRRPGVIRIRVLTTATAATPLQPHPRETARSCTARPTVFPRRASLLPRPHPKSLQGHAHSTRLTPSPRRAAASGLIGLQTGPRIHQRSLPGHTAHDHPGRKGRHPSDPPIISRIGGERAGRISASRSETTPSKLSPAHCSRAPQCVKALKADPAVSADNTTTPPSGRQSETPTRRCRRPRIRQQQGGRNAALGGHGGRHGTDSLSASGGANPGGLCRAKRPGRNRGNQLTS
jgi:hypothetical protein